MREVAGIVRPVLVTPARVRDVGGIVVTAEPRDLSVADCEHQHLLVLIVPPGRTRSVAAAALNHRAVTGSGEHDVLHGDASGIPRR